MKILYVGDIMGKAGRDITVSLLPSLKSEFSIDFVIAQAENIDDNGHGPRPSDIRQMAEAGVDFFTGGNHSFAQPKTGELYSDTDAPLVRPANIIGKTGQGYKIVSKGGVRILISSILGQTVGNQKLICRNPLDTIDEILTDERGNFDVSLVNFHGDYSSEKVVFGQYLDGRVSVVVGDHWHTPTADARILPAGTAHITDVGMCGALNSSLGVKTSIIAERWKTGKASRNIMETKGPYQFNALLTDIDTATGLAKNVSHIQRIIE